MFDNSVLAARKVRCRPREPRPSRIRLRMSWIVCIRESYIGADLCILGPSPTLNNLVDLVCGDVYQADTLIIVNQLFQIMIVLGASRMGCRIICSC